ncbi:hypothetical protein DPMN_015666 [Dreissena polymorpha]|uniref:Uncharacterized protein n=1 Tax=Dreissena polymorpha TaxID=45954 RepID=A0A9D4N871_DREPO|nr:hypothetical protein DPMN_015666 [Dreissena polymorpha]
MGARNTINTTGSKSSPKHASTGSNTLQTERSCLLVEGSVGKSTTPQPINRESPPSRLLLWNRYPNTHLIYAPPPLYRLSRGIHPLRDALLWLPGGPPR